MQSVSNLRYKVNRRRKEDAPRFARTGKKKNKIMKESLFLPVYF